jgi:tetratricopeptide (TPR) repeat protein
LQEGLAQYFPMVPRYRIELASSNNNLGDLLSAQSKPPETKEAYERAVGLLEKLTKEMPDADEIRINLAGTSSNLGNLIRDQGKLVEALPWYDKAIGLLVDLAGKDPPPLNARLFLRNASWDRANTLGQLRKHDLAVTDWQRAIALDDGGDRAALGLFLGTAQWEIKLKKSAVADKTAGLNYDAAKAHAQAAGAAAAKSEPTLHKQYSGRALELLRQAQSAGYFRDAAQIERMQKDAAFDSLRKLPEYQKLVQELAAR